MGDADFFVFLVLFDFYLCFVHFADRWGGVGGPMTWGVPHGPSASIDLSVDHSGQKVGASCLVVVVWFLFVVAMLEAFGALGG